MYMALGSFTSRTRAVDAAKDTLNIECNSSDIASTLLDIERTPLNIARPSRTSPSLPPPLARTPLPSPSGRA